MQNNSSTKQIRKPAKSGFLWTLAAMLLSVMMWTTGAKAAPLSGTYTIGPTGTYPSFAAAVSALNANGVSAAVLFNVAPTSFTESIGVGYISGVSSTNTVTFRGAGRLKTTLTSSGTTLAFNSAQYIIFDQMTISSSLTGGDLIYTNSDIGCGVTNCNIIAPVGSGTVYMVHTYYATNFSLVNNYIYGGYYGLFNTQYSTNSSTTQGFNNFSKNRFIKTYYYPIYVNNGLGSTYNFNVVDSGAATLQYAIYSVYETGATYNGNQLLAPAYYGFIIQVQNYYSWNKPINFTFTNNFITNFINYGGEWIPQYSVYPCIFSHNTIYNNSGIYAILIEDLYCNPNTQVFSSNILYSTVSNYALYLYVINNSGSFPAPYSSFDGNDIYTTGGPYCYYYNGSSTTTYNDYASYSKAMQALGAEKMGSNVPVPFIKAPNNLHVDQTKTVPSGVYAGIDYDIDGDARCKLFPTAGADESFYGKNKPIVNFFVPASVFPNSPMYIYQTAKDGEPKVHAWYLNGVKVSTSVTLFTNQFVVGTNCLKLVTLTCGGSDSVTKCFTVAAPTAVPGTDFIANKNTIQQGQSVDFKDLSSNGPTKWAWTVSPDSTLSSGVKVPAIRFLNSTTATDQNPTIQFNYGGKYKVCMTATNGVGKGATVCKTNYINVLPAVNMGSKSVINEATGYLFDNGGPNGNYTAVASPYKTGMLIDPCADSVYLTLSMFDMYCGYDFLRMYEGRDAGGKPLWSSKCSASGSGGTGPGYTGGKATTCGSICMPDVVKPDTFRAKSTMYIETACYIASNSAGFSAFWWSKPRTSTKSKASFTTSNAGDSVCTNGQMFYTNTTKQNPNDLASFLWDLDGDITTFECIGTCATASYPYFLAGNVDVTLIATNCGGADTAKRTLTVYNPKAPKAAFVADNTTPTTNDIVFFSSTTPQCVDDYKWTITPVAPNTGKAVYLNGTSNLSGNPQVNFTSVGYYDVEMFVDNASGAQKDDLLKSKYILVRNAYCIPSVAVMNQGLGITHVIFNTIDNKMTQAATEYSNYVPNQSLSTTLAVGATYNITISRDAAYLFEPINRSVYIDWNGDGSFVGAGEMAASDSNTYTTDFTAKITVPKTAKLGATVMRIAANRGTYSNKPCGQNEFGEYQDYRLYITPYNILPVITLKGTQGLKDTIKIEQGNPFVDPGYSASSFLYGNITANVVLTSKPNLNVVIPGVYVLNYNVADSATPVANKAITQYRVVEITKDMTPPALIVGTPDTTYQEVTKTPRHPVPVPGVISADDLVDGPLAGSVIIDSGKVQTNIVGIYVVSYTVTDLSGNTSTVYRVVDVIDTIPPTLKLIGNDPTTLEVYNAYLEQGVTAIDNYNTAGELNPNIVISSNVDTAHLGSYTVTYTLTDKSGNKANALTRTVNVVDTVAPSISLNGNQSDMVPVNTTYTDLGVTVSDNYDKTGVTISISGTYYNKFPAGKKPDVIGTYTITYTATDKSGNKASVTRTVVVKDITAPVISLIGDPAVSVCRWFPYVDAGYEVSDDYDNAPVVTHEGTFYTNGGTTMTNLLYLRYIATDASGNVGYSGYRYIEVKPETDFTCLSTVKGDLNLDKYITVYPNPSTGMFTINASLPAQEKVRMSVTNMLGQEIAVIHNGVLGTNSFQLDLSNQPSGIYMLNVVSNNKTSTRRIEITK